MSNSVIYEQFEKTAAQFPRQTAIIEGERSFTYADLEQRICIIAENFPSKTDFVGIVTDHGMDQIASIFAVLKTGSAYVPAEPDFPEERIRFMMKESGVSFIITQKKYQDKLQGFPLLFLEEITEEPSICRLTETEAAADRLPKQGDHAGTGRAARPVRLSPFRTLKQKKIFCH